MRWLGRLLTQLLRVGLKVEMMEWLIDGVWGGDVVLLWLVVLPHDSYTLVDINPVTTAVLLSFQSTSIPCQ